MFVTIQILHKFKWTIQRFLSATCNSCTIQSMLFHQLHFSNPNVKFYFVPFSFFWSGMGQEKKGNSKQPVLLWYILYKNSPVKNTSKKWNNMPSKSSRKYGISGPGWLSHWQSANFWWTAPGLQTKYDNKSAAIIVHRQKQIISGNKLLCIFDQFMWASFC